MMSPAFLICAQTSRIFHPRCEQYPHLSRNGVQQWALAPKRGRQHRRRNSASPFVHASTTSPSSSPSSPQPRWPDWPFQKNEVVSERYIITDVLGQGANGITYEAALVDDKASSLVALKALSFKTMNSWKALDLFQREASTLRALSHPAIPTYIDFFELDKGGDRVFVLVQRKAPGTSLQRLLDDGYRFTTEQVTAIFRQLLEVLQYLASLNPPVLHRDVKPSNVILDLSSSDGLSLNLVDFGGVNTGVLSSATSGSLGSTMVGTFGYMAPEQFGGATDVRSDLFAAAATVLCMLTGRSPSSLPQKRLKIDVESIIPTRERLKLGNVYTVMVKLLEPAPEDRYDTATEALDALLSRVETTSDEGPVSGHGSGWDDAFMGLSASLSMEDALSLDRAFANIGRAASSRAGPIEVLTGWAGRGMRRRKPAGSRVTLDRDRSNRLLRVLMPPKGLSGDTLSKGIFAMAWTSFTAFWTVGVLTGGAPVIVSLFSLPFWAAGFQMARSTVDEVTGLTTLVISFGGGEREVFYFGLTSKGAFGRVSFVDGDARDLNYAVLETQMYINEKPVTELVLQEGTRRHVFGKGLDPVEQEWLRDEINDFLHCRRRR